MMSRINGSHCCSGSEWTFFPPRDRSPTTSSSKRKKSCKTTIVQQRSLSIYTLLGALQSAFWFFALPFLCRPLWPILFGRFSPQVAEALLFALPAPYFIIYATVVALPPYLLQWEFFEQYKLSKDPWPWLMYETEDENDSCNNNMNNNISDAKNEDRHDNKTICNGSGDKPQRRRWQHQQQQGRKYRKLLLKSLFIDMASVFVYFPTCIYIKSLLLPSTTLSFDMDDWPTLYQSAIVVPAMAIFHELLFYGSHRIMHAFPTLYKYHKIHHEYKQNTILAAQYFHLVDFLITISGPIVLTTILFRPHSFTQFQVGLWIFTANLDDHLGYAFPWSAVRWFPFSAGTDTHEFHHRVNMGCYGSKLSLWDWFFRTDVDYERRRVERGNEAK